ncbi:chaperone protein dnaJ C76, chloroplastic [Cynara cardunculus var. scolymus]|uniref:chaperone protein dnaJ C76, chloroplastic n=1 Tax=Cynara cardunculus var. scolymus TaxID=59895 RepID=UPI000D625538|nr:chaperone protein dnaJ C76, chloroplastic [Cynara cardunculus var. scolymus]
MHSIIISPYTLTPSRSSTIVPLTSLKSKTSSSFWNWNKSCSDHASLVCKASGSTSSSITDFDLYDLLGVDSSSDHLTIKQAYRTLQKKCHPDIAGVPGHDMAIILNEAYAVLSDPLSRFSYDKEQAKVADFKGYTGKPIYSVWYGSESEQRAIFVDEVKCVGCLKCALFAEKTFAIESVYGRARVIAQWADPENKIQEAIGACPVDCISMVERSKLAALEFLMSKQPRGSVRIGAGNTVGTRVSNIFVEVDKFQDKFLEAMEKGSSKRSKDQDLGWEARISAIQAIRSITNWLYWQPPIPGMPATQTRRKLLQLPQNSTQSKSPNIDKLRDAAAARKQAQKTAKPKPSNSTEYWTPSPFILPESTNNESDTKASHTPTSKKPKGGSYNRFVVSKKIRSSNPYETGVPVGMAIVAAVVVRLQLGDAAGGIETHIGGSLLLDVVNSSWLQVILAGVTWYLVGMAAVELVAALRIKSHEE